MRYASDKLIRKMKTMKTLLLCCILLTAATARTAAQSIEPRVSEEVELMSALARTAGYEEYAMNLGGSYTADIDSCMGPCRTHPAVAFMQEIRRTNGISYDAVMSMALLLKYCDGRFVLMPQQETMLDKRWATVDKERFLALLSDFHARSRFRDFFVAHEPLYAAGIAAFRESIMTGFDQTWYADFYGTEAQETFTVVIGFCNGGQNYGIRRHLEGGPEEAVSVIGYVVDSNGVPQYDGSYLALLIHEFNHSFVNPLLTDHAALLERSGKILLATTRYAMAVQAYGNWQTLLNESLVRAATICYMQAHDYPLRTVKAMLVEELSRNFYWMPELVGLLHEYERERSAYPTFASFCPRIAAFFDGVAETQVNRIEAVLQQ